MARMIVAVGMLMALANSAWASDSRSDLWREIRELALKCSIQPYAQDADGQILYGKIRSICKELRIRGEQAEFSLPSDRNYVAILKESPFSDGGDLYDVILLDQTGKTIGERDSVLAFGDPILALVGSKADFQQEYDSALLTRIH